MDCHGPCARRYKGVCLLSFNFNLNVYFALSVSFLAIRERKRMFDLRSGSRGLQCVDWRICRPCFANHLLWESQVSQRMTLLTVWFMPCALARRVSVLPVIRIGRLHRLPRVWCPTGRCLLNSFMLCSVWPLLWRFEREKRRFDRWSGLRALRSVE